MFVKPIEVLGIDLSLYKEALSHIPERTFFGDKIYNDRDFFTDVYEKYHSNMLTPVKGMSEVLRNFDRASDDLYSRAVSKGQVAYRVPVQLAYRKRGHPKGQ